MTLPCAKTGPLKGIRVLDLTNVLSGPFCCHQLSHLGAEVIKVERPEKGDLARELGADPELNSRLMGTSFLAQNSGKKSVTLDLKTARGKAMLRKLVATADVLVENFRPGVMGRLGLGFADLVKVSPRLIYCAITGFGQEGELSAAPAYDQIIQGMSGAMSITGEPDSAPLRVGYPVADTAGGLTAALAIVACLAEKGRDRGHFIDVSMLDSMMTTMGWAISNYLNAGVEPTPGGNENFTASPSGTFKTARGPINIAANKQEHFEALCHVIGREDLISDPRFSRRQARLENRKVLNEIIGQALMTQPAAKWRELLLEADVPCGEVLKVSEALALPHLAEREFVAEFSDVSAVGRPVRILRTGFRIDGAPLAVASPPPRLGEHNDLLLGMQEGDEEVAAVPEREPLP